MSSVRIGEVEINVAVDGDGPWLTLLHGFSQNLHIWAPQVERMAESFRLLRIDLRGHGGSSAPEGGYGPVEYAADVLGVLDALNIRATHFWGTHTGAGVGLLLAVQQPERLATLVIDGAVIPGQPEPVVDAWQALARNVAQHDGVRAALDFWFEQAPFFGDTRRAAEHRAIIDTFSGAPWLARGPAAPVPDVLPDLALIRQQTLVINGGNDLPSFLTRAVFLEQTLPNASRYVVPDAGAFAAWDAPDAVTPLVAGFLAEG